LTAAGQTAGGQNTCGLNINGVYEWRLTYKSTGFTAISLLVRSAPPDVNGVCTAATWVAFAGTVVGVNPNTATTQNTASFTGFYPCVSVILTSVMGAGTVTGQLYGCREPGCSISGASIVTVIPTPVPVDGPTAAGAAPTTPPVLVAGQDGAPGLIRTIKTDSVGELIPSNTSNADADGVSNTEATATGAAGGILYPRVFGRVFNGATWDRLAGNTTGIAQANTSINFGGDPAANVNPTPSTVAGLRMMYGTVPNWWDGASLRVARGNNTGLMLSNATSNITDNLGPSLPGFSLLDQSQFIFFRSIGYGFNGTAYDRTRLASLANFPLATTLTARNDLGITIVQNQDNFSVVATGAAGAQASASIAAEAGVRHVADSFCFTAQSAGAVAAAAGSVALRDGASGAGTIVMNFTVAIPAAAGTGAQEVQPFCVPAQRQLTGTTNTAMTAEFNTGFGNVVESVTLVGHNVN
jgi:hypothetical protein